MITLKSNIPRICVCCHPRSGSSMLMRMLQFGGLVVRNSLDDKDLMNDYRNPYGQFEDECLTNISEDGSMKVIPIYILPRVPSIKLIYLKRSVFEMQASWDEIYQRQAKRGLKTMPRDVAHFMTLYDWEKEFERRQDILRLEYNSICENPLNAAKQISDFIDTDDFKFDYTKAATAVDKSLYIDRRK